MEEAGKAGYKGIVFLYHSVSRHATVRWVGTDVNPIEKKLTERSLLALFTDCSCPEGLAFPKEEINEEVKEQVSNGQPETAAAESAPVNEEEKPAEMEADSADSADGIPFNIEQLTNELADQAAAASAAASAANAAPEAAGDGKETMAVVDQSELACDEASMIDIAEKCLDDVIETDKTLEISERDSTRHLLASKLKRSRLLGRADNSSQGHLYQCSVCEQTFRLKQQLLQHMATHSNERIHECSYCDRKFVLKTSLVQHELTHTAPEGGYSCSVCGKHFMRKQWLLKHEAQHKAADAGEEPPVYKCGVCDLEFSSKRSLNSHSHVHRENPFDPDQPVIMMKPHQCGICGKRFNTRQMLSTHELIHTGEKPHQCNICGRRFTQRPHLKTHLLTHTGEKRHECRVCGKRFALRGNCTAHEITHIKRAELD